jgi:Flp pilus assembly protein TadG
MNALPTRIGSKYRRSNQDGQSLLETAIAIPLLLGIAFNLINFGYFWFMVLSLSAIPRHGVEFSAQGGLPSGSAPTATQISNLVFDNMTNGVHGATTSNTAVRVCIGGNCSSFGAAFTFPTPPGDPEAPTLFSLNRVDVEYNVTPIISGSAFNVVLPANLKFQRQVSMRSLY